MSNLFRREGLQQDTGLLRDRWNQEGSVLKSSTVYLGTSHETLFTVTAGKALFIKTITFFTGEGAGVHTTTIRDGGSGGVVKVSLAAAANTIGIQYTMVFDAPLKFETDCVAVQLAAAALSITAIGWEEDAK